MIMPIMYCTRDYNDSMAIKYLMLHVLSYQNAISKSECSIKAFCFQSTR